MTKPPLILVEDSEPHGAALNMAIDEALLLSVIAPLLRFYRWARPAASFGYFGSLREAAETWPEREWVRRWTGGGIVPHGEDFTYSLIVPRAHPWAAMGVRESYRVIHQAVARAVEIACGSQPELAAEIAPSISGACFENPALSDVLLGSRKIAGAAQRRTQAGMLHQGSVQLPPDARGFAEALAEALGASGSRALSGQELAAAEEIAKAKYGTQSWLQRR